MPIYQTPPVWQRPLRSHHTAHAAGHSVALSCARSPMRGTACAGSSGKQQRDTQFNTQSSPEVKIPAPSAGRTSCAGSSKQKRDGQIQTF
eukprot:1161675-Pelagomonas_calceolata.AAC.4